MKYYLTFFHLHSQAIRSMVMILSKMDLQLDHIGQDPKEQVQSYIDNALAALLDELSSPDGHPTITLKRRSRKSAYYINLSNGALKANETDTYVSYSWPGRDAHEAWRFSMESQVSMDRACSIYGF